MAIFKAKTPKSAGNAPATRNQHKNQRTYEFRVYTLSLAYSGELELLTTTTIKMKDIFDHGRGNRPITLASKTAEEYVRNIGMYGITVESPEEVYNYYPPNRIGKVEYNEVDD